MWGGGRLLSYIAVGPGSPATPTLVQGFAGPIIYVGGISESAGPGTGFPTYVAPLVGATGMSMQMTTFNALTPDILPATLILDDAWAWSTFLTWFAAQMCLRFNVSVDAWSGGGTRNIIGSAGQLGEGCVSINCNSNGTTVTFTATLTTGLSGKQTITSSAVTAAAPHNVEMDYNGSFFDFYIDGVNQGHLAATGRVAKTPWETISLGDLLSSGEGGALIYQITGAVQSIELSKVARHTGTGSFVPPVAAYTADANTIWLWNCDQPAAPAGQPFVIAQTVVPTISNFGLYTGPPVTFQTALTPGPISDASAGMNPHYMRLGGWSNNFMDYLGSPLVYFHDFQVVCGSGTSGIVAYAANNNFYKNLVVSWPTAYGVKLNDGFSFYGNIEDIAVSEAIGVGVRFGAGLDSSRIYTGGCGIGQQITSGNHRMGSDQPGWNSFIPFVFAPGQSSSTPQIIQGCGNDEEGSFPYQQCAMFVGTTSPLVFISNFWDSGAGTANGTPAVIYGTVSQNGVTHIGDIFNADSSRGGVCISTFNKYPSFTGVNFPAIRLRQCNTDSPVGEGIVSDIYGLVAVETAGGITNQTGLSASSTPANNLAGTFTILHGYTSGGPTFLTPEVDGNYIVNIAYIGYVGSSPAAGSTTIGPYTTGKGGFVMDQGTDPAGTCMTIWSWQLTRIPNAPLYYSYLPTIPSTAVNPLTISDPIGPFAVGVSVVPVTGHCFAYDNTQGTQVFVEAGTPSTNWWQLGVVDGFNQYGDTGPGNLSQFDSFVSNGKLYGWLNPGTHNVALAITLDAPTLEGLSVQASYVDSALAEYFYNNPSSAGTQQTPMTIGEHTGGTDQLVIGTLRNLKVDILPQLVWTFEPDMGPQSGQTISAFLGDQMTLGFNAGAAGIGGFATQIAEDKYASSYYWIAATRSATVLNDLLPTFWGQWGGQQTLAAMVFLGGFNDCLTDSATGADVYAGILQILNGIDATVTVVPPVQNIYAVAEFVVPTSGSATCVIDGISILSTFNTSPNQTVLDLIAACQANGTLNSLFTFSTIVTGVMLVTSDEPGFAGNAYTTSTNGGGGAFWYPGSNFFQGSNGTLTIEGVTFQWIFDTDADTTVNDMITLIGASGPTIALVTPTLVNHQLLLTAVSSGAVGNAITVGSNNSQGTSIVGGFSTLQGGANGAVQNGINPIVLCTVPPFGQAPGYTMAKDTQRNALNTLIRAVSLSGVTIADVDTTLRDPAMHQNMDAAYLSVDNINPNDAGHAALYSLIQPLLP